MHISRVDKVLTNAVRILYAGGSFVSIVSFFASAAIRIPTVVDIGLALLLGAAASAHEFLTQRRVHLLLSHLTKSKQRKELDISLKGQLVLHGFIMALLVTFMMFTGWTLQTEIQFHSSPFSPQLTVSLRAAVTPLLFFLSTFLTHVDEDGASVLSDATHTLLLSTTKGAKEQWEHRIQNAREKGADLTPIVTALLENESDSEGAKTVNLIADGLRATEEITSRAKSQKARALYLPQSRNGSGAAPLSVRGENESETERQTESNVVSISRRAVRKGAKKTSAKQRKIESILASQPDISTNELASRAGVSWSTAKRIQSEWLVERNLRVS